MYRPLMFGARVPNMGERGIGSGLNTGSNTQYSGEMTKMSDYYNFGDKTDGRKASEIH